MEDLEDIFGSWTLWDNGHKTDRDVLTEEEEIKDVRWRMSPLSSQTCRVQGCVMAETGSP